MMLSLSLLKTAVRLILAILAYTAIQSSYCLQFVVCGIHVKETPLLEQIPIPRDRKVCVLCPYGEREPAVEETIAPSLQ